MSIWASIGTWLVSLLRRPEVQKAATNMVDTVIDQALHGDEPSNPLPATAVNHQQAQIEAATSHKVARCTKPPPGWSCSRGAGHLGACAATEVHPPLVGPSIVKAKPRPVDRDAKTPPARPPRRIQ